MEAQLKGKKDVKLMLASHNGAPPADGHANGKATKRAARASATKRAARAQTSHGRESKESKQRYESKSALPPTQPRRPDKWAWKDSKTEAKTNSYSHKASPTLPAAKHASPVTRVRGHPLGWHSCQRRVWCGVRRAQLQIWWGRLAQSMRCHVPKHSVSCSRCLLCPTR